MTGRARNNDAVVAHAARELFGDLYGRRGPGTTRTKGARAAPRAGAGRTLAGDTPGARAVASRAAGRGRAAAARLVGRAPEVVVRIVGAARSMPATRALAHYVSRGGLVPLEDERGERFVGEHAVHDVLAPWDVGGRGIPRRAADGHRREALHLALSMPPGTDREGLAHAARAFARQSFAGHTWALTPHADRDHPHLHVLVASSSTDTRSRLNPDKAQLRAYRETFARALREQGIEASATPRALRGVLQRGRTRAVKELDELFARGRADAPSRATEDQERAAREEVRTGVRRPNPAAERIAASRAAVLTRWGTLARALNAGDEPDRVLAAGIREYVATFDRTDRTLHAERVAAIRAREASVERAIR